MASRDSLRAISLKRALSLGEQAAFLWESRRGLVYSSAVTFEAVATLDGRVSRLVDRLSERPEFAERLLDHEYPACESGLAFVAAVVALRGGELGVFDELLNRLETDTGLLTPLASALTWLDYRDVRAQLKRLVAASSPPRVQLGIQAAVAHRVNPAAALKGALQANDPALRASALKAVGWFGAQDLQSGLRGALENDDPTCRFWAAWSTVRLGDPSAIPVLGRFTAEGGPWARAACDIALRALDPRDALRAQKRLLSHSGDERLGVLAAGIIGDPALATWLLDAMESPQIARLAGAAFCLMTGRDLRRDDLDSQSPPVATGEGVASAQVAAREEVASAPVATDAAEEQRSTSSGGEAVLDEGDDDLPWPDPVRLRVWWNGNRRAFAPGIRYLAGVPIRAPGLAEVLRTGNQQQRAAAALELALLDPDAPLLDVTGPAHRQIGRSARPA